MTKTACVVAGALDESSPSGQSGLFPNVLVGVDGTRTGRDAIALGELLRGASGRMTLAHVVLSQAPTFRNFHSAPAWKASREMLKRERELTGVRAAVTGMASISVGSGLHQLVEDCGADLPVVGSCSRGRVGRMLRGDDTRGSLSGASCTVAVAPHGYAARQHQMRTIGVGYDGTTESEAALAAARTLAVRHGAAAQVRTVVNHRPSEEPRAFADEVDLLSWDCAAMAHFGEWMPGVSQRDSPAQPIARCC
jgi:nucleotide-binding universal stress UspA family protein